MTSKIEQLSLFTSFLGTTKEIGWKMTLNHYPKGEEIQEATTAFPWHTDIASNGEVTAILTLLAQGTVEFLPHSKSDQEVGIDLFPGSLLLLTGPARWEWLHRVVRTSAKERISLVFGAQGNAVSE